MNYFTRERYLALQERMGVQPVFPTLEDFVERSSALIGSPAQVIGKVHRYHEQFGHSVLHLHADAGGLPPARHRAGSASHYRKQLSAPVDPSRRAPARAEHPLRR